VSKGSKQIK